VSSTKAAIAQDLDANEATSISYAASAFYSVSTASRFFIQYLANLLRRITVLVYQRLQMFGAHAERFSYSSQQNCDAATAFH
jgi:hypothetical protein